MATEPYDTRLAKQLYDAIIAPLEPALQKASINTLVFIHDGFLRSVPMAALYDGQQFLVERYAIATTPALTLTASGSSQAEGARALVLGTSQAVQVGDRRFRPLPEVPGEVASILATLPGSRDLVDGDFNQAELERALQLTNYSILHFATHGQFSPDPQENFLVTGQGEKLTFSQLEGFIRNGARGNQQVDLVMLTACETAAGDDRATLGLAGLAIRAGARRAVASLWQVEDQVTAEIARDFYAFLSQGDSSPAQALQRAQIEVIKTQQGRAIPGKWAALVLVGNWL
ncbi:MAG: CHAT domain-containing protein [Nodosilinea sp.]